MTSAEPTASTTCQNCGAPLTGRFCAQCGQSDEDLKRPLWSLVRDSVMDLFDLDGRMLRTIGALYRRPGKVAREYVDGKRARYTPPFRMFFVVSVALFALFAVTDLRIIALEWQVTVIGDDENYEPGADAFRFGDAADRVELPAYLEDIIASFGTSPNVGVVMRTLGNFTRAMATDPARLERQVGAAAGQAMLAMVIVFMLLNAAFRPRRRFIEHLVHSLYLHAAALPLAAAIIVFFASARALTGFEIGVWAYYLLAAPFLVILCPFDRGFYGSSWSGAIVRGILMTLLYAILWLVCVILLILAAING